MSDKALLLPALLLSLQLLMLQAVNAMPVDIFTRHSPRADRELAEMTLEEKIGQMLVAWAPAERGGRDSDQLEILEPLVRQGKVGGIMFLKGNLQDAILIANHFQSLAPRSLLLSADMEKGLAMRLEGATEFVAAMALAATDEPAMAYRVAQAIAIEARQANITHSYGPTADLNTNPENPIINTRSFGDDITRTSTMVNAYIDGLQDHGVIATVKHFPGHGDADTDSHIALPVLSWNRERLEAIELKPFRAAIGHGVMSVMVGHLAIPSLTGDMTPASISKKIVTGLLRNELGFRGLIITDALNMKSLYGEFSTGEIIIKAVEAGNDLLLFPPDPEKAHATLLRAVQEGRLPEGRIDDAVHRILVAKEWTSGFQPEHAGNSRWNIELARITAERSLTLVRDRNHALPLDTQQAAKIVHLDFQHNRGGSSSASFSDKLSEEFDVTTFSLDASASDDLYSSARNSAAKASAVILSTSAEALSGALELPLPHRKFIQELERILPDDRPLIMVSFGSPYIIRSYPGIPTFLCTYSALPAAEDAVIKALKGSLHPSGVLPVSLEAPLR
ncbi:glycoside hydrolase family 3 protein [Prosthecochloris vibrioformis]|uniref:beta-N-acetylhexosaminidase n=1 Tax=Prosthecochloris vibrioformis TaxID=1098 RepID=A0A5C4RZC7_PROVB|nr:glycoside hydrolase family 3 protein [Prosthecochloris vibrioformis]TNJ36480.1 glycoside hydrolase family 3 protein [Prosthecochloris vibrioformis]